MDDKNEIVKAWKNVLTKKQLTLAFKHRAQDLELIPKYDPWDIDPNEFYYDPTAADMAADFFPSCLKLVKGPRENEPFELEPWQRAIVRSIFGWKCHNCVEDPYQENVRRYRKVLIYLPRKNGKSTFGAGLVLYLLFMTKEKGLEIYSAARDVKQAAIIFKIAKAMVQKEPMLEDRSRLYKNSIVKRDENGVETNSWYQPITAEADGTHGFDAYAYIVDELHNQPNRDLLDVLETSTGARTEPLGICITTADFERKSICNEKLAEAHDIIAGYNLGKRNLPVIYETGKEDDWHDPEVWKKANPGYGTSVQISVFKEDYEKAVRDSDFENTFKRLRLNLKTEQSRRWLQMTYWNACTTTEVERLQNEVCYGGLDLASTEDITAFLLYFPHRNNLLLPWFWIPEENPKCEKEPYLSWIKKEFLLTTPGNQTDYDFIEVKIGELNELYKLVDIGIDPYNSSHIGNHLQEKYGIMITRFPQTYAGMNEPCKHFQSLMKKKELSHNNHPVLSWMASNVSVREDAYGNIRPDRPGSSQKIDGIVAALMALGRYMFSEPLELESKYENEDLLIL